MKPILWDLRKERENWRKHSVAFSEAETVFLNELARIHDDPDHSMGEGREIIVGHSAFGRLLIISFVEQEDHIRIISARRATAHERHDYEENI